MPSITDADLDLNPKYLSVKEFETLVATKPFDEVLENVMKAYDLGIDVNSWPGQSIKSTKQSTLNDDYRNFQIDDEYVQQKS